MARKIDPTSFVTLPPLSAAEAEALGQALVTAARERRKSLPKKAADGILDSADAVDAAVEAVRTALQSRVSTQGEPAAAKRSDVVMDSAVRSLYRFLLAFAEAPNLEPESTKARAALAALFPDGLGIIQLRYVAEWSAVDKLLREAEAHGHAAVITQLGGGRLLDLTRAAFKTYGEALGITDARTAAAHTGVHEPLVELKDAIRWHVLEVVTGLKGKADAKLRTALLEPLTDWKEGGRSHTAADDSSAAPTTDGH